ncbi:glycosyltransferase 87 family protein [Streptomyces sp. 6N223]|uniref:glycosyltransferase 87 family protein n=1 Tax=Streptomyces sp. 6N223 TaxID=3457412 RepID=UPI003FD1E214
MLSSRMRSAWAGAAVVVALGLTALAYALLHDDPFWAMDLHVYRATGSDFASGDNPYPDPHEGLYFTYPPFAAAIVVPLSLPSLSVAAALLILVSVTCLMGAVWSSLALLGVRDLALRAPLTLAATCAALWLHPVRDTLWLGQVNLIVMFLVMYDLTRDGKKGHGLLIGLATGIKLMPGIFVLYLLITGRVKAAITAVATFVGTVLLSLLILPKAAWHFWTDAFFDTSRYGFPQNVNSQSMRSALARLTHTPDIVEPVWWAAVLVTLGAAMAVAVWADRRGNKPLAIATVATAGLLISPVAWEHHWVWVVPGLLFLLHALITRPASIAGRAGVLASIGLLVALCLSGPLEWVTFGEQEGLEYTGIEQLYANSYVLAGLLAIYIPALLLLLRGRGAVRRTAPARTGEPAPAGERPRRSPEGIGPT